MGDLVGLARLDPPYLLSKYFRTAFRWRGLSLRFQVACPAAASSSRRAERGADAAASSVGAVFCSETTSSLGWSRNPLGSTTSLNFVPCLSVSSPQVSSASARPRLTPPLPGRPPSRCP